ncbi:MAG: GNAT family N-acetyltransferase, partial [Bacteroidetes bacterium]
YKGQGLGKLLLIDAIKRSFYVAEEHVASKAVIVDPIDNAAVSFYAKYGFTTIPDTGRMFMTMNKIREALQAE